MNVLVYSKDDWKEYSESAHMLVFNEQKDSSKERIDFALLAHDERAIGFVTCREIDSESLYWQYGGAIEEYRGFLAYKGFKCFYDFCTQRYKRITTLVKNDNVNYLHLLMKFGFRAIGIRNFKSDILLEMYWEGNNGNVQCLQEAP